jgi:hypothetical protein
LSRGSSTSFDSVTTSTVRLFDYFQMGPSALLNEYGLNLRFQAGKAWYFGGAVDMGFNTFKSTYRDEIIKGKDWFINPNFILGFRIGIFNKSESRNKLFIKFHFQSGSKWNKFSRLKWKSEDKVLEDFTSVKLVQANEFLTAGFGVEFYFR